MGSAEDQQSAASGERERDPLQLQALGITLLSIVLSVAVTVAFGISGPAWLRFLAGLAVMLGLVLVIGLGARPGRGPIARLARWITNVGP